MVPSTPVKTDQPTTSLICGYFDFDSPQDNLILDAMPDLIHIKNEEPARTSMLDHAGAQRIFQLLTQTACYRREVSGKDGISDADVTSTTNVDVYFCDRQNLFWLVSR